MKFYGEVVSIDASYLKATNDDGAEIKVALKDVDKALVQTIHLGTKIKFDGTLGDVFYKKGKERIWTFVKNVIAAE